MPIKCLNSGCYEEFDDLEDYHRHLIGHDVDEGASFTSDVATAGAMYR